MPRLKADTREEVKAVALDLFSKQGFEQTSLREIADRLGITKAALYYHFSSKQDLLQTLLAPLMVDMDAFLSAPQADARTVLQGYFDLCYRHRQLFLGLLADAQVVSRLDLFHTVLGWRERLDAILVGDNRTDRVRAVVALGGLQDCVILFADDPDIALVRAQAVNAALRALEDADPRGEAPRPE